MSRFSISQEVLQAIIGNLEQQPFKAVASLIEAIIKDHKIIDEVPVVKEVPVAQEVHE